MKIKKTWLNRSKFFKKEVWGTMGSFSSLRQRTKSHVFPICVPFLLGIIDVSLQNSLKKLNKENEEEN